MFPTLQPGEMLVVLLVAVLLFGKRLPEVGRSLGKGIVEFKKGLRGVDDGFDISSTSVPATRTENAYSSDDAGTISVPKFEPPTAAPSPTPSYEPQTTPH
ncbi:MAG: twin arginine-targeting protein translocase, TatA/E family [Planctomycetota bacterium]|nr:twin arginine-targeting protein translocase, TatA/E family [Planctomycetota bacterium]